MTSLSAPAATLPPIAAAPKRLPRPFWSVMLPAYNPDRRYLAAALDSVLAQDPGPSEMQICVVDDASPDGGVEELTAELGGGRVEYHRRPRNGGLARAWNTAVALACGTWVHLLHQDDLVYDGFYERLRAAAERRPDLGAAYTQHFLVDAHGRRKALMSTNPATTPGVVDDWIEMVFARLTFQTPAVVVKREAYETLGGFRTDLRYALDWDMWKRIAAAYPFWYDPAPLAGYRRHPGAVSVDFLRSGKNMAEVRRSIELAEEYLPADRRAGMRTAAADRWRETAVDGALNGLFALGDWRIATAQLAEARKFDAPGGLAPLVVRRFFAAVARRFKERSLVEPGS